MKTLKQAKKDYSNFSRLITAVVNQIGGVKSLEDVVNHTYASAGWPGFTYFSDTHAFAMRNRKQIVELLNETAYQLGEGEEVVSMVKNFGIFKGDMDREELQDLYKFLGGGRPKQGSVTNIMAWFALEEVARMFQD